MIRSIINRMLHFGFRAHSGGKAELVVELVLELGDGIMEMEFRMGFRKVWIWAERKRKRGMREFIFL